MRFSRLLRVSGLLISTQILCICSPATAAANQLRADFFVAPSGSDANSGTREAPFATLGRARDAVRQHRLQQPDRDIRVLLRGGTYRLRETVVFGLADAASPGRRITYMAYAEERPVFTSAVPIDDWERADISPERLSRAASGQIWSANVPSDVPDVVVLFDGERRLPRARGSGFHPDPVTGPATGSLHALSLAPGVMPARTGSEPLSLVIIPTWPWIMNILPITDYDEATTTIQTDVPATYPLGGPRFGGFPEGSAWIENALEDLDEPGEWVFDAQAGRLYLWPTGSTPSDELAVPRLTELLRIEGKIDDAGPADEPVSGLVFRGLHFTQGDRFRWETNKSGWGLQHDWEMFDRPTALVRLRGAENCRFEGCRFTNSGGAGIRLDLHSRHNVLRGNLFSHLGGVAILLAGYGPGTKDVNQHNKVEGNHIHHIGELLWHSPAIFAWQSGQNRIHNNLIHHCPYTAIVVSGRIIWDRAGARECSRTIRWHEVDPALAEERGPLTWAQRERFLHGRGNIVEGNEIHDVMEVLADGNCIYVSGTGAGNIIRGNYQHDVTSPHMNAAIRCDDDQHETTITGNLIWRTCGEGFIFKGKNTITHNIVADMRDCQPDGSRPSRGFLVMPYGDVTESVVQHNIFYSTDREMKIMTEGRRSGMPFSRLRDCEADWNLYFCIDDPGWGQAHIREQCRHGVECHSRATDPRFVDPGQGDFRLLPDSPAHEIGIAPMSITRIDRDTFPFNE